MIRMRFNQLVWLPERIVVIAAPAIFGRIIDHAGAHRIELNVPLAGEEIPLTLQAGMILTLP